MDFHIITSRDAELVMRLVDGVLEVVPPAPVEEIVAAQLTPSEIPSKRVV